MNENPVFARIRQELAENSVVLFMKGTPMFPQCGFSAAVVQVLTHMGVKFKGIDVLTDPSLREGVKQFANWPTLPQLYVKGEFIGGCDIVRDMYESGELQQVLDEKGPDRGCACRPWRRRHIRSQADDSTSALPCAIAWNLDIANLGCGAGRVGAWHDSVGNTVGLEESVTLCRALVGVFPAEGKEDRG
jgi:monothiol glutaredoxin